LLKVAQLGDPSLPASADIDGTIEAVDWALNPVLLLYYGFVRGDERVLKQAYWVPGGLGGEVKLVKHVPILTYNALGLAQNLAPLRALKEAVEGAGGKAKVVYARFSEGYVVKAHIAVYGVNGFTACFEGKRSLDTRMYVLNDENPIQAGGLNVYVVEVHFNPMKSRLSPNSGNEYVLADQNGNPLYTPPSGTPPPSFDNSVTATTLVGAPDITELAPPESLQRDGDVADSANVDPLDPFVYVPWGVLSYVHVPNDLFGWKYTATATDSSNNANTVAYDLATLIAQSMADASAFYGNVLNITDGSVRTDFVEKLRKYFQAVDSFYKGPVGRVWFHISVNEKLTHGLTFVAFPIVKVRTKDGKVKHYVYGSAGSQVFGTLRAFLDPQDPNYTSHVQLREPTTPYASSMTALGDVMVANSDFIDAVRYEALAGEVLAVPPHREGIIVVNADYGEARIDIRTNAY